MNKKLIISAIAVVAIVGGIYTKNSIAKSKFEQGVQKEVAKDNSIKSIDGDYFCNGIFTTECGIDNLKMVITNRKSAYRKSNDIILTAKSIEIDNIAAANKFSSIKSTEPIDVLKGLMDINDNYTFNIKGLKFSVNDNNEDFIKKLKQQAKNDFSKNDYDFFEKLVNLYEDNGLNISSYISIDDNAVLSSTSDINGFGLSFGFESVLNLKKDDIKNANRYTIINSLLSTKISAFSLKAETLDYSVPELAAFLLKLPNQKSKYKQRRFERKLKRLGINSNFKDFSEDDIKNFFNSDNGKNTLNKMTIQIENNINMFIRDKKTNEYIHDLLKDVNEKFSALGRGKDDSLKVTLSTNNKTIQELLNEIQTKGNLDLKDSLNISIK
ncbi:hypothetical protein [Arcobacter sp. CECT 8985]|uniref:hypothetical protein n=1 Tax=Arcobacter sp. CECT 8985 TaxID=1935424 RepID=UPI00100BB27D|nr:hypothetical protein [Arcobacter sp. CECT 8985]RXJ83871.1 hypothetical protein CRU93_13375 [Arcobacter sp. CECT 8985]